MRHRPSGEPHWKKGHRARLSRAKGSSHLVNPGARAGRRLPSLLSLESEGDRVICVIQVRPGRHCPPWLVRGQRSQYREAPPWLRVKGTRKRRPKRAGKSRNSEEWASQKPRPSLGRRRTGVARTLTNAGPAESSPAVSAQTLSRCTSLQFFLPVSRGGAASHTTFPFVEVIAPRPSHLVFWS